MTDAPAKGAMPEYVLGNSDVEYERLQRQARLVEPMTERLLHKAGIGPGQRVVDLGAGVGDVSLLLSRLVGPTGEVVGLERDPRSVAHARARASAAGLSNLRFIECEVENLPELGLFDAVVGRFILHWLGDPLAVLRSVADLVRPGGAVAFQEPWIAPVLTLLQPLPLWSAAASIYGNTLRGAGANPELGLALFDMFQEAGLPAPEVWQEIAIGRNLENARWYVGGLRTLLPHATALNLPVRELGDLATLAERLEDEAVLARSVTAVLAAPVSAWARKR
jgi:ubiquinone/menaquinone biosynthesis C-methylase UbiE